MPARFLPAIALLLTVTGGPHTTLAHDEPASLAARDSARHVRFTRLLNRFVSEEGLVDFARLRPRADSLLVPYLRQLAATNPAQLPTRDARLAFWLNAYNAYALKLVIDHYPVENIWGTTPGPPKPFKENSPFTRVVAVVADTAWTLDEIEHQIIRKRFEEPRIHFAVNCAAAGCPRLRREAYVGPRLDAQLQSQAHAFLHNDTKNRVPAGEKAIALSPILKWFLEDFGPSTSALQKHLSQYFEGRVRDRLAEASYEVRFLPFDWSLNDQGG